MPKGDKLTKKQEAFLREYLKSLDVVQAYTAAYDVKSMTRESIRREGNDLLKHPLIAPRLVSVIRKAEAKDLLTLEKHMERLDELSKKAETLEQISAAIKAEELRGKLRKFYVEQIEVTTKVQAMSDDELEAELASKADLVAALARN